MWLWDAAPDPARGVLVIYDTGTIVTYKNLNWEVLNSEHICLKVFCQEVWALYLKAQNIFRAKLELMRKGINSYLHSIFGGGANKNNV